MTTRSSGSSTQPPAHSFYVWVKAEPFSYGTLSIPPPPRLSTNCIKKSLAYAKNKGELGFPRISYTVWRHIACNKIHLPEDLAWLYFSTCHLLSENTSPAERIEWNQRFAKCTTSQDKESLKNHLTVNTYKFVLYLYIQQFNKVSLKASLVAGDGWPTSSAYHDSDSKVNRRLKAMDEHSHLGFVQNHLMEMLELLIDPENRTAAAATISSSSPCLGRDLQVSHDILEALGFLISASADKCRTLIGLADLLQLPGVKSKICYSKTTQSVPIQSLYYWLKENLVPNLFGPSACASSGRRLSWRMLGEDPRSENNFKRGRIATNAHIVSKEAIKGNKIIFMSQVSKQTVARSSATLENSNIKIHRCHGSNLYLLAPLRSVTVQKCRHSKIVLGPVETSVHIENCEFVTVIAPCHRIVINSSQLCTLHLLTPNHPVILNGNDSVVLAPYHTHYPKLEEHMARVGLEASCNLWDQPLCLGSDHRESAPVWELMKPEDFFLFNIPFEMEGSTKAVPCELPRVYRDIITHRQRSVITWQKLVKDAKLSPDQIKEFQEVIETHFCIWLTENGHKRELENLALPPHNATSVQASH